MVAGGAAALLLVGWIGYQMGVPVWVPSMQRMQRAEQPLLKAPSAVEEAKQQATPPLSARVPAVVALTDAEAKRKADEAEQQRLAAAKVEEERKAKRREARQRKAEQAEKERLAAAKTEEERKATAAAEAEAKRKSEEAERQRQAAALVSQSSTALNNGDNDKAIATASEALRLNPDDRRRSYQSGRRLCEKRRPRPSHCRLQRGNPTISQLRPSFLQSGQREAENQRRER